MVKNRDAQVEIGLMNPRGGVEIVQEKGMLSLNWKRAQTAAVLVSGTALHWGSEPEDEF